MIKGKLETKDGRDVLFLGLSQENLSRLVADEPMRIQGAELASIGLPAVDVVIMYGTTEAAIVEQLRAHGMIDDTATVRHERECGHPECLGSHSDVVPGP